VLLLTSTSDLIQLITSGISVTVDVQASWIDFTSTTQTPGRTNTAIATSTTTTVVASPAGSTQRNVKRLMVRNKHASASCTVTVRHTDGTTAVELFKITLLTKETLSFDEEGFKVFDANGYTYIG